MSSADLNEIDQQNVDRIWQLAVEPSYISEIARKLRGLYGEWASMNENTAVARVARTVFLLEQTRGIDIVTMPPDAGGQLESSPKFSVAPVEESGGDRLEDVDVEDLSTAGASNVTATWQDYKIIHNTRTPTDEVDDDILEVVDPDMAVEEKLELVKNVSGDGNEVSKEAELILQDVMERQFREYDSVESSDYNDPGLDFAVDGEQRREWGLAIEVSTRWVNPIDRPYLDAKKEKALKEDYDLLVIAPRFTDSLKDEYEDPDKPGWHDDPFGEMVHLHRVPSRVPEVYSPFAKKPEELGDTDETEGNPVIVPDDSSVRNRASSIGNIGNRYPVGSSDKDVLRDSLAAVDRRYSVISESRYRNQIREALEPLLWRFLRPYQIEQFIIDMYWDKGLTQAQTGTLVDRTGGTIGDWMQKWGIIRRGTGAPELGSEVEEIWTRMYRGDDPFPEQFSGYRIQAEYNRHPLWDLSDWREWYSNTNEEERKETMRLQDSHRDNIDYMLMVGVTDRLQPSYSFILKTLRENGVEIRPPDEAPRVPYSAYTSRKAVGYMLNKDENTIVDVSE